MLTMNITKSLVTFVGMRDPYPDGDEEPGPILSLLLSAEKAGKPFDEVWLLCTGGTFLEKAQGLRAEAADEGVAARFWPLDFPLRDVIDYGEIWEQLGRSLTAVRERAGAAPREWHFLLDSGTPQMKTSLFLAARSGLFPARLIQGIPARFAGGAYKPREVRQDVLPELFDRPDPGRREIAASVIMANRIEKLRAEPRDAADAAFEEARRRAMSAARYDEPILILGETGTGKTMLARLVHESGCRAAGPFIEVNCSAIPESLAESELFGHDKGAFTGASGKRTGKIRAADGGDLFLDEIGDLPLDLQAKLLKAIDEGVVTPLGSDEPARVSVRVIAATNRDLPAMIGRGEFRRDLYERIKVTVLRLPPLRERRGDIARLAGDFVAEWNESYGDSRYLTKDALKALESYSWPGNVRELRNAIKSASCTSQVDALGPEFLPDEIRSQLKPEGLCAARSGALSSGEREGALSDASVEIPEGGISLRARMLQVEWAYVSKALRLCRGNREAAARLLGLTGHAFRKALRERFAAFLDEGADEQI